ncbi:MAG: acetolactate synthase small subunit [Campylobacterales bacterium]
MDVRKIISVIVINEHGVLSRISGLFAGRGYNIESLTVAPIPDSEFSRVTIATVGNKRVIEQIIKQLHKLIPVYKVNEHDEMVEKELAMVKLPIDSSLADVEALCNGYNGKIANANENWLIVMVSDKPARVTNFLKAIKRFKPKEIVRSGVVAIERN